MLTAIYILYLCSPITEDSPINLGRNVFTLGIILFPVHSYFGWCNSFKTHWIIITATISNNNLIFDNSHKFRKINIKKLNFTYLISHWVILQVFLFFWSVSSLLSYSRTFLARCSVCPLQNSNEKISEHSKN